MKKVLIATLAAACVLSGSVAPVAAAPNTTVELQNVRSVYAYRCWTYDTAGGRWYGLHTYLPEARRLAMYACRQNMAYGAVCYHVQGPCEEGFF